MALTATGSPERRTVAGCTSAHTVLSRSHWLCIYDYGLQEVCFSEEMDGMQSSSDSSSSCDSDDYLVGDVGGNSLGAQRLRIKEWVDLDTTGHNSNQHEDTCANLEWSQFINSAHGVVQYLKQATAVILDVSGLEPPSPRHEHTSQLLDNTVEDTDGKPGLATTSSGVFLPGNSGTPSEPTPSLPATPPNFLGVNESLKVMVESSGHESNPEYDGPNLVKRLVPEDQTREDSSAPCIPISTDCLAAVARKTDAHADVFPAEKCVSEVGNDRDVTHAAFPVSRTGLAERLPNELSKPPVGPPPQSSAKQACPELPSGQMPLSTSSERDTLPALVPVASLLTVTVPRESLSGHPSAKDVLHSLVDTKGSEPELPSDPSAETSNIFPRQQEGALPLPVQPKKGGAGIEDRTSMVVDTVSHTDVVASVGEAAVARRIEREMARSLEAKRKRRDDNIRE